MRAARATPLGMLAIAATRLGAQPAAPPPSTPSRGAPVLAASRGAAVPAAVQVSGGTVVPPVPLARVDGVAHVMVGDAYVVVADAPLLTELPLAGPRCAPGRCAIGAVRVFANRDWTLEVSLAPAADSAMGDAPLVGLVSPDGGAEAPLAPGAWTPLATAATPAAGATAVVWLHLRDAAGAPVPPRAIGAVGARLRFRLVPPAAPPTAPAAGTPPPDGR